MLVMWVTGYAYSARGEMYGKENPAICQRGSVVAEETIPEFLILYMSHNFFITIFI
jgi:hypothetical protein